MQKNEKKSGQLTQPRGKLQVLVSDKCLAVTSVKDVSPTGIRLEIKTPISIGENIMIREAPNKSSHWRKPVSS